LKAWLFAEALSSLPSVSIFMAASTVGWHAVVCWQCIPFALLNRCDGWRRSMLFPLWPLLEPVVQIWSNVRQWYRLFVCIRLIYNCIALLKGTNNQRHDTAELEKGRQGIQLPHNLPIRVFGWNEVAGIFAEGWIVVKCVECVVGEMMHILELRTTDLHQLHLYNDYVLDHCFYG
jgi:hypothetical protein